MTAPPRRRGEPPPQRAEPPGQCADDLRADHLRPDDAALIEWSWQEPETFAELYDRHAAPIHRYVSRRLGDAMADDAGAGGLAAYDDSATPLTAYNALASLPSNPATILTMVGAIVGTTPRDWENWASGSAVSELAPTSQGQAEFDTWPSCYGTPTRRLRPRLRPTCTGPWRISRE